MAASTRRMVPSPSRAFQISFGPADGSVVEENVRSDKAFLRNIKERMGDQASAVDGIAKVISEPRAGHAAESKSCLAQAAAMNTKSVTRRHESNASVLGDITNHAIKVDDDDDDVVEIVAPPSKKNLVRLLKN